MVQQLEANKEAHKMRHEQATEAVNQLEEDVPQSLKWAVVLAQEEGASSWFTLLTYRRVWVCAS